MSTFKNLLPGVPIIESPFFKQAMASDLWDEYTKSVAQQLFDQGFAVIDFPDTDFDDTAELLKQELNGSFNWEQWRREGYESGLGLRVQDAWKDHEPVRRLATNQKIIDLLTKLFGRQAWPFQTLNFPVGTQQHFHTDSVHFSSVPERFMCGVWTALEDIDESAGPLVYYPGSHKWPIYSHEHMWICSALTPSVRIQETFEPLWEGLIAEHKIEPAYFLPKKGQSLIWLANLLHGGTKQQDKNKTRWSQVTHYYFEGCAYYQPHMSDPMYGSIDFAEPMDIVTGKKAVNKYCGFEIPEDFVRSAVANVVKDRGAELPKDFSAEEYLLANPDVKAAGGDAAAHYRYFGAREGRPLRR